MRWIDEGRKRLNQPNLFAYEAGAIRENERDYNRAIAEYAKGALLQPGSNAQLRLLLLAKRPALRASIDNLTSNLTSARNPDVNAIRLRVALLKDQNRRDDLEKLLLQIAVRTDSQDVLAELEETARATGLPRAQQASIERHIAITTDPVDRMSLRLSLARFQEGQGRNRSRSPGHRRRLSRKPGNLQRRESSGRLQLAQQESAPLRRHPGRGRQPRRARLQNQLHPGGRPQSHRIAGLHESPFLRHKASNNQPLNPEYISTMADTYARQADDAGLRVFYGLKIRELVAARQTDQTAQLRRALIPVLVRTRDYTGAVDQYIEILNRFPEDAGLTREAATFARTNNVIARLHDYYVKTATASAEDIPTRPCFWRASKRGGVPRRHCELHEGCRHPS